MAAKVGGILVIRVKECTHVQEKKAVNWKINEKYVWDNNKMIFRMLANVCNNVERIDNII